MKAQRRGRLGAGARLLAVLAVVAASVAGPSAGEEAGGAAAWSVFGLLPSTSSSSSSSSGREEVHSAPGGVPDDSDSGSLSELNADLKEAGSVLRALGSEYGEKEGAQEKEEAEQPVPQHRHRPRRRRHAFVGGRREIGVNGGIRTGLDGLGDLQSIDREIASIAAGEDLVPRLHRPPPVRTPLPHPLPLPHPHPRPAALLVVVSVPGFRHDYLRRYYCPSMQKLAQRGVRVGTLAPVFPASAWPNAWSVATGLPVSAHGIMDSNMFDESAHRVFDAATSREPAWWKGEPWWAAAQRRNITVGMVSWPGADVRVRGVSPAYLKPYSASSAADDDAHVRAALSLLDMPAAGRPRLLGLELGGVAEAASRHGPASWQAVRAVEEADAAVGRVLDGLAARGLAAAANVVVLSSRGFATVDRAGGAVYLDDYVDLAAFDVLRWGPVLQLRPKVDRVETLINATTTRVPHVTLWRREAVPAALRLDPARLSPVVGVPDTGFYVTSRARGPRRGEGRLVGGDGYMPEDARMGGTLLVSGPAVASPGARVPAAPAMSVHALVCQLLGVARAEGSAPLPSALRDALVQ